MLKYVWIFYVFVYTWRRDIKEDWINQTEHPYDLEVASMGERVAAGWEGVRERVLDFNIIFSFITFLIFIFS